MTTEQEIYDRHGIPVREADVIRTFHFTGPRRRKYYLYHVAVLRNGRLYGVPAHELAVKPDGGTFLLSTDSLVNSEIVQCGKFETDADGKCILFNERLRRSKQEATA